MSGIVCAIRGGPDSQPTIAKAVSLAQERDLPVYFLYVVDLNFLVQTSSARLHTISKEMDQMGEFILLTAQAKAEARGVTAHGVVRHGQVRDQIVALCREVEAGYVVLGRPKGQNQERNVFTHDHLDAFAQSISRETGAQVVFAGGAE